MCQCCDREIEDTQGQPAGKRHEIEDDDTGERVWDTVTSKVRRHGCEKIWKCEGDPEGICGVGALRSW